jgi:hypothetical protein
MDVTDSSGRIRSETMDDLLMPLGIGVATLIERVVIGHPTKTFFPELTSVLGMEKSCGAAPSPRVEQPENAESPSDLRDAGRRTDLRAEQFAKADAPMDEMESGRKSAVFPMEEFSDLQPANAESPIEMMEFGISMRERLMHPANREAGMVVCGVGSWRIRMEVRDPRLIPDGIGTDAPRDREVIGQLRKAFEPIEVTVLGMKISSGFDVEPRFLQFWKAASPIEDNRVGARRLLRAQFSNADFPIDFRLGGKLAIWRVAQLAKADSSMDASFAGSVTDVRDEQFANAEVPMTVMDSGRLRDDWLIEDFRAEQSWKVADCRDWMPAGMLTEARERHPEKQDAPKVFTEFGMINP